MKNETIDNILAVSIAQMLEGHVLSKRDLERYEDILDKAKRILRSLVKDRD